jgi:chromosome segregation ATPase
VLRSRVGSTQDEIYAMHSEMEQIERNLVTIGAQMVDPTTTNEQRAQLLVDTKHMAERKGEIKARLPELEGELALQQRELDDYRATLTFVE